MRPYDRIDDVTATLVARVRVDRPLAHVEPRRHLRSPMIRVPGDRSVPTEAAGSARPARLPAEPVHAAGAAATGARSVRGREMCSSRSASMQFRVWIVARVEHGALGRLGARPMVRRSAHNSGRGRLVSHVAPAFVCAPQTGRLRSRGHRLCYETARPAPA
jgi:hypothetical protein